MEYSKKQLFATLGVKESFATAQSAIESNTVILPASGDFKPMYARVTLAASREPDGKNHSLRITAQFGSAHNGAHAPAVRIAFKTENGDTDTYKFHYSLLAGHQNDNTSEDDIHLMQCAFGDAVVNLDTYYEPSSDKAIDACLEGIGKLLEKARAVPDNLVLKRKTFVR